MYVFQVPRLRWQTLLLSIWIAMNKMKKRLGVFSVEEIQDLHHIGLKIGKNKMKTVQLN
jgi:hypothetical protein